MKRQLNFLEVKPYIVAKWIESNKNGNRLDYIKGKEDTKEVIRRLGRLPYGMFNDIDKLKGWFLKNLGMRVAQTNSLYRAFLSIKNDKIINLRVADHFSTMNSATKAFGLYGKSDYEYHISPEQSGNANGDSIDDDCIINYKGKRIEIIVATIWLDEFIVDGNENCKKIIDDLIFLLQKGRKRNSTQENFTFVVSNGDVFENANVYNIAKLNTNHILTIDEFLAESSNDGL